MIWVHGQRLLEVLTDGIAAHSTCRATSWSFKSRGAMFLSNDAAVQPPPRPRRHYSMLSICGSGRFVQYTLSRRGLIVSDYVPVRMAYQLLFGESSMCFGLCGCRSGTEVKPEQRMWMYYG